MSLIVPLRKDIECYEDRVFGSLTKRRIVWGGIAIAVSIGILLSTIFLGVPQNVASWIYIFIGGPILFVGFAETKSGEKPSVWLRQQIAHYFEKNSWEYESESPYLEEQERSEARALTNKQIKKIRQEPEYTQLGNN